MLEKSLTCPWSHFSLMKLELILQVLLDPAEHQLRLSVKCCYVRWSWLWLCVVVPPDVSILQRADSLSF